MHFHLAQSRLPHCPRTVFLLLSLKDTVSTKYLLTANILNSRGFKDYIQNIPAVRSFMKSKKVDQLTFKVFIEYLVQTPLRSFDIHWVPIYLTCKPCLVSYSFIGKTETMTTDSKAILERIGVNRYLTVANAQAMYTY